MTTKFILFRHGQTKWNVGERFRGHADLALNENGLMQAQKIATRLKDEDISAIYSSPLRRALQTAQPLAIARRLSVQKHEGLGDIDFGALEGMNFEEARQSFPDVIEMWLNHPGRVKFPKGESFETMRTRIQAMLDELSGMHDGQTIALVSHKVVCGAILCLVLGMDANALWQVQQDVACINRFEKRSSGWVVTLVNDLDHVS
jgi:broad specificity phosphatase PhoE